MDINLPKKIGERLDAAAKQTGIAKDDLICAAIERHLDDLEDTCLAEQVLAKVREGSMPTHDLADVEHDLKLVDSR